MTFEWMKIPYSLLTLFIVLNYGLLMTAIIAKIGARAGRRIGIPFYQNYIDLLKNYALRSKITHGYMFYLGPVFRLTGGIGLLLFVPTIYGSEMFS
ncbi:MAG TPA: NADH-quinone oxidoreductase subunit H, partial [Aliiroseovarius sp.]|nr:NADH-quinone oxidoreductase subunit H [Aliiroseovarius sp.]